MTEPSADPYIGTRIREYQVLELIAAGRMGGMYRARHSLLEQDRALKVIHIGATVPAGLSDRFIRESRILARMRHPNLVELYDFGQLQEGTFFMVFELLQGETVRARMKGTDVIPVKDAVGIVREAALGLHLAHSMNVLHRDLSPDNLFLLKNPTDDHTMKVIDFAVAKPTAQEARALQLTAALTPHPEFLSPEQFGVGGDNIQIDARSDIYSLAVTLYYMLCGKLPFVSLVPKGTPEPFPSGQIPPKLENMLRKALSIEREQRHQSMIEFIEDLSAVTYEFSTTLRVPHSAQPVRFQPGYVFAGRYEIEKKIGRGGMGTVFKAKDQILDIPVALKTMNLDISRDDKTLARLKREVILARKVAHPNVCRLYDIGEAEEMHYVSMEYVDGSTLSDLLLVQGKLSTQEGLGILRQVLLALQAAHHAGVIHRDLKPQNIMVDTSHRAFIMDFGISFSADVGRITTTGMMVGTPRYMAPEQFGEGMADFRSDLYSMGIIFYEAFTGRLPFDANTPASMMYAHLHTPPTPPSQLEPQISPRLEAIILRALEKNPENRYQSADEILRDVDNLVNEIKLPAPTTMPPTVASAPVIPATPKKLTPAATGSVAAPPFVPLIQPGEERSKALPIAVILMALVVVGLGWYYLQHRSKTPPNGKNGPVAGPTTQPPTPQPEIVKNQQPQATPAQPITTPETQSTQAQTEPTAAPPTEPATPTQRTLAIDSQPPGATILLDGTDTGKVTPATLSLDTGRNTRRLDLRLTGYEPAHRDIDDTSANSIHIALSIIPPVPVPQPVPTQPEPANPSGSGKISYKGAIPVSIYDGRKLLLNTATADSMELPAGSYKLTIVSTQKALIRQNIRAQVIAGQTTEIAAPAMADLTLRTTPEGCSIYIDGVRMETAPVSLPIQAGNHTIRLVWEQLGKEKNAFFTVEAGKSLVLKAIAKDSGIDIFQEVSS